MNSSTRVSRDTYAILLLCGHLDGDRSFKPLSAREYSDLAEVLHGQGLRPGDLLERGMHALQELVTGPAAAALRIDVGRLRGLLQREVQAAVAIEQWSASGIFICGRGDEFYPKRYRKRLGRSSPPILYVAGNGELLNADKTAAIVGSRKIDEGARSSAATIARSAVEGGCVVVSGAARGTDEEAMLAALDFGGCAVGVIAENLLKATVFKPYRRALEDGRIVLISAFGVNAPFSVGIAMARNKLIYALADRSMVVASEPEKGGTWAGATEALSIGLPVNVLYSRPMSEGNAALALRGAVVVDEKWRPIAESQAVRHVTSPVITGELDRAATLWSAARPLLLELLQRRLSAKDVAAALDIIPKQAEAWLRRLVDEGAATKKGSKYEARVGEGDTQMPLLEG